MKEQEMMISDMKISRELSKRLPGTFGKWFARKADMLDAQLSGMSEEEAQEYLQTIYNNKDGGGKHE